MGVSGDASNNVRAVLWRKGVPVDLSSLVPTTSGLYLLLACGINVEGQIIGLAIDGSGAFHGYVATPRASGRDVDEPAHPEGAEISGPLQLPQFVREKLHQQFQFLGLMSKVNQAE